MVECELLNATVMIIDDDLPNLRLMAALLTDAGSKVQAFADGEMALSAALRSPPDIVLLDVIMPGMSGYEVCERMKQSAALRDVPVLFVSGHQDPQAKVTAFNQGGVDYITKPFGIEELTARLNLHLKMRRLQKELEEHTRNLEARVAKQVEEITEAQHATILALAKLSESRDDDTGHHIERVQEISRALAEEMRDVGQVDGRFVEHIYRASPLHDIGKVGIPDAILLKPGKLTSEEFEVIKRHPLLGAMTLDVVHRSYPGNAFIQMGRDIALSHHERWDGTGYPSRLEGNEIPLSARIVAVADVYDALRSKRPYKEPWPHDRARSTIEEQRGRQFDPLVIDAFARVEDRLDAIRARLMD